MKDFALPFITAGCEANGRIVKLEESLTKILNKHNYPDVVSNLLCELIIANVILGQNLKHDGMVSCQLGSKDGIVKLAASEFIHGGKIRAYASFDENAKITEKTSFEELTNFGDLIVTYESNYSKYQGIVKLGNVSLSDSLREYFNNSEQIETKLKIEYSSENLLDQKIYKAAGFLISKIPDEDKNRTKKNISPASSDTQQNNEEENTNSVKENNNNWEKFKIFTDSLTKKELLKDNPEDILKKLFHEDGVILYDKRPITFSCRCSREKMNDFLTRMSEKEKEQIKQSDEKIHMKCQFCGQEEIF